MFPFIWKTSFKFLVAYLSLTKCLFADMGGAALGKMGVMFFSMVGSPCCLISLKGGRDFSDWRFAMFSPCFHSCTMYLDGQMVQSCYLLVLYTDFNLISTIVAALLWITCWSWWMPSRWELYCRICLQMINPWVMFRFSSSVAYQICTTWVQKKKIYVLHSICLNQALSDTVKLEWRLTDKTTYFMLETSLQLYNIE